MQKRIFDLTIVGVSAVFWLPGMALLVCLVAIFLGRPVFFTQLRPGIGGRPFKIIKFRTMTEVIESDGNLSPDSVRLTGFGKVLRSTSLDELPELWNVLLGDMSLVGPRPLLMEYLPLYSPEQARRHDVRPGITGWAQVNGRNAISWDDKFTLDCWYVDNHGLMLDLKILYLTVHRVLKCTDINQTGEATVKRFVGNDREK